MLPITVAIFDLPLMASDRFLTNMVLLNSDIICYTNSCFVDIVMTANIYLVFNYFRLQQASICKFTFTLTSDDVITSPAVSRDTDYMGMAAGI